MFCFSIVQRRYWSCLVYCLSLCTLYLSSTLYHSFFTLKATKRIFQIFDHAAIFLLIAGTYTPFLAILFPDREIWSVYLLAFLWMVCAFGIGLTAFFHGPSKQHILLALYLSMGWAILLCISDVIARLDPMGLRWLIIGGLCYTGGVPFFIKDGHMDHAVWHLFVLAGSICHWIGIYCYLIPVGLSSHATA